DCCNRSPARWVFDSEIKRSGAAHGMAHQICPALIDVEILFNHVQNIQHVFFAHFTHPRRIGDSLSTGVRTKSTSSCRSSALRSGGATVPARRTNRDAIPASRVIPHGSNEDVTALLRQFHRSVTLADHRVLIPTQTMQCNDERILFVLPYL